MNVSEIIREKLLAARIARLNAEAALENLASEMNSQQIELARLVIAGYDGSIQTLEELQQVVR